MKLVDFALEKRVVTWTLTVVVLVAGFKTFGSLNRLEDPEFTIKNAQIVTPYPGATPEEVEKEVSDLIERAVQELGQLLRVESWSRRGVSIVRVTIKDQFDKTTLPQVWDELRRKVNDYQTQLPPGAGPSRVNDDFGDVFGIYVALYGEGYSNAELREAAKLVRRELTPLGEVKKVVLWGVQQEAVYVEMSRTRMAALEISQQEIFDALAAKNIVVNAGRLLVGPEYLPVDPTGYFTSEQQFGNLLIRPAAGGQPVFLRDVATIRRDYVDPPKQLMRFNGEPAVAIGISTRQGGNVVVMGEQIAERLRTLVCQVPLGMIFGIVGLQSQTVTESINGFLVNLVEAVLIVVVVLLIFMGLKSGLIIGGILVLTISGTFLLMGAYDVILERISLGALIIALGMLVDNAIVVIDGMQVRIEGGMDKNQAAREVVGQNAIPLLGATAVAIMAFAAIGTSQDSTGEYTRSLFTVIMMSLGLSWVTAVTTTPLVGVTLLKPKPGAGEGSVTDPYGAKPYQIYKKFLVTCLRFRYVTAGVVAAVFVVSIIAFGQVKQMFFPGSTRPQFYMEVYFPAGTNIWETQRQLAKVEQHLQGLEGVTEVATAIGGGDLRFLLTYTPQDGGGSYGAVFVSVERWQLVDQIIPPLQQALDTIVPMATVNVKKFLLGPGEGGRVQLRLSGPDRTVLRDLAAQAKNIFREETGQGIRDEWREPEKVVRPLLSESQANRLGIDRPEVAQAIQAAYDGFQTGVYREGDELLPILVRAPDFEREDFDFDELQIWSRAAQRMVPMGQVITGTETAVEDATIYRWNRVTTIRIHTDATFGQLNSELLARAKGRIERELGNGVDLKAYFGKNVGDDALDALTASTIPITFMDQIPLKDMPGYFMAWGGEEEDSAKAKAALAGSIPIFFGLMVLIVIGLFNTLRQPLIIWLTVPLAVIGVAWGLLLSGQPFGFMALLGFMSLSGMLIKNAIVLIDEISVQRKSKEPFDAVVGSGLSRMRPVMMAALTTILGMMPLLLDAFFVSMAVTIMAGLLVATVLTLVIVPTLYVIFYRVQIPD